MRHLVSLVALSLALGLTAPPVTSRRSPPAGHPEPHSDLAGYTLPQIMDRIARKESGRDDTALGDIGEVGRHQVSPIGLADYNRRHGTHHTLRQLRADPRLEHTVAADLFIVAWNAYSNLTPGYRMICALSAYNRGVTGTREKGIGWAYAEDVLAGAR